VRQQRARRRRQRAKYSVWSQNDRPELDNGWLPCTTGADGAAMSGGVWGAAAVIVASAGWSDAGEPDGVAGGVGGAAFADELVGPVGGECAGGCGDRTGASGTTSVGVAGAASGVAGNEVSALMSPSAELSRCHRLGRVEARSVMSASGDMRSLRCWANAENSSSRVLGSQSLSGVLRIAQALGLSWGHASGVKGAAPWLRNAGRLMDADPR
jgi:hypothetical protein